MSSGWATRWATPTGARRCGPTRPACCCPASARASSRWPPRRPGPGRGGAPVAVPLRRQGRLGRRDPAEGGARLRAPCDAGAWAGPGLAGRRHRAAEEGQALGRGGQAVLRPARQAGQPPGGGDALGRDRARQPAGRLPADLPEAWADDPARRALAGVPEEVGFATKPSIALDQIGQALADGVPPGVVVTDAGYGNDTDFRDGVTAGSPLRGRHPGHDRPVAARHGTAAGRDRGAVARRRPPGPRRVRRRHARRPASPARAGRPSAGLGNTRRSVRQRSADDPDRQSGDLIGRSTGRPTSRIRAGLLGEVCAAFGLPEPGSAVPPSTARRSQPGYNVPRAASVH